MTYVNFDAEAFDSLLTAEDVDSRSLAAAMGRSPRSIRNWREGRSEPTLETIQKMADLLKVPATLMINI